jgi:hypothetical protein
LTDLTSARQLFPRLASPRRDFPSRREVASLRLSPRDLALPRPAGTSPHVAAQPRPRLASLSRNLASRRLASTGLKSPRRNLPSPHLTSPKARLSSPHLTSPRQRLASLRLASHLSAAVSSRLPVPSLPHLPSLRLASHLLAETSRNPRLVSRRLASPHADRLAKTSPRLTSPRLASHHTPSPAHAHTPWPKKEIRA